VGFTIEVILILRRKVHESKENSENTLKIDGKVRLLCGNLNMPLSKD
jgi:hypothetical protein